MSWPTDGKPRYVGSIDSESRPAGGNAIVVRVYDRAVCHRVVAVYIHRVRLFAERALRDLLSEANAA